MITKTAPVLNSLEGQHVDPVNTNSYPSITQCQLPSIPTFLLSLIPSLPQYPELCNPQPHRQQLPLSEDPSLSLNHFSSSLSSLASTDSTAHPHCHCQPSTGSAPAATQPEWPGSLFLWDLDSKGDPWLHPTAFPWSSHSPDEAFMPCLSPGISQTSPPFSHSAGKCVFQLAGKLAAFIREFYILRCPPN